MSTGKKPTEKHQIETPNEQVYRYLKERSEEEEQEEGLEGVDEKEEIGRKTERQGCASTSLSL